MMSPLPKTAAASNLMEWLLATVMTAVVAAVLLIVAEQAGRVVGKYRVDRPYVMLK